MRVATAPINWNNEDVPNYRPATPFPRVLDEIITAGYRATEWSASFPADADGLRHELGARGLRLTASFIGLNLREQSQHEREIARACERATFLHSLGAEYLIVADSGDAKRRSLAGRISEADALTDEQWRNLCSGLESLAQRVREIGLQLTFHNHVGTYVETEGETDQLLASTEPGLVGWCLDTGHLVYGGSDLGAMVQRFGSRINYVHLKDVDGEVLLAARENEWGFADALRAHVFTFLGRGVGEVSETLRALKRLKYASWLVLEQDTTPVDPTETARRNRHYVADVLRLI